ncbi:MAG: hypothetical protein RBT61_08725 [Candidatus Kapabacteria bacterium]|jgi:homogentisate 1,2-dioxygenase|nr:hypothetical protein [Candidatus Kapabacteria bacterium]
MPFYHKLGRVPKKKHTTMYKSDGTLYKEELVSSKGFSGIYSNKYHIHIPTRTLRLKEVSPLELRVWKILHYNISTFIQTRLK